MKVSRELLEDRLESYQEELKGFSSYVKELKAMTAKHGTNTAEFEEDLREAEHNLTFYEAQIATIKKEIDGSPSGKPTQTGGTSAPQNPRKGISSVLFSSIGFIAGALFGSRLKSRKDK